MASSGNNNQGNSSSEESNEIFQSSEILQSAQNFDDGLLPMDDDELFLTAPEEIINQALSRRQHRRTLSAVRQGQFPSETITENIPTTGSEDMFASEAFPTRSPRERTPPTTGSEDMFASEAFPTRRPRESTPPGLSPDNSVASDEASPQPKRHKEYSSSSTTDDDIRVPLPTTRPREYNSSSSTTDDDISVPLPATRPREYNSSSRKTDDDINVHQSQGPGTSMKDSSSTEYITEHHPSTSSTEYIKPLLPSTATMALIDETVRKILNEEASSTEDEQTGQAVTPSDISTDEKPSQPILTHDLFSQVLSHISSDQSPSGVDTRNNEQRASFFVARCIKTIEEEAGCNISHEQATFMFVMIISQYLNEYCKKSKPDHIEEMKKHIENQCDSFLIVKYCFLK